jgi:hypothetical protein
MTAGGRQLRSHIVPARSEVPVRRCLVPFVAVLLAVPALVLVSASPSAALDEPIDVRAEHDRPQSFGPKVLLRTGVTAGPGVELDAGDHWENPTEFEGNVMVDIDPDARTITVSTEQVDCYETVLVQITTDEIEAITNVSDTLFGGANVRTEDVSGGVISILWNTDASCEDLAQGGEAVFIWGAPEPPPPPPPGPSVGTATLSPASVPVGDPVVVRGDECHSGVVLFDVVPRGGTLQDLVYSAEVQTSADGTWEHTIDTTGWDPGDYDVDPIECIEPEDDNNRDVYNYEPLEFEVTDAAVGPGASTSIPGEVTTTTVPAGTTPAGTARTPAAQPTTAVPTYTG